MKFESTAHQDFFLNMCLRIKELGYSLSVYHKALFYTLGINRDTRTHTHDIFDFNLHGNQIKPDGLNCGWQTIGRRRV